MQFVDDRNANGFASFDGADVRICHKALKSDLQLAVGVCTWVPGFKAVVEGVVEIQRVKMRLLKDYVSDAHPGPKYHPP